MNRPHDAPQTGQGSPPSAVPLAAGAGARRPMPPDVAAGLASALAEALVAEIARRRSATSEAGSVESAGGLDRVWPDCPRLLRFPAGRGRLALVDAAARAVRPTSEVER